MELGSLPNKSVDFFFFLSQLFWWAEDSLSIEKVYSRQIQERKDTQACSFYCTSNDNNKVIYGRESCSACHLESTSWAPRRASPVVKKKVGGERWLQFFCDASEGSWEWDGSRDWCWTCLSEEEDTKRGASPATHEGGGAVGGEKDRRSGEKEEETIVWKWLTRVAGRWMAVTPCNRNSDHRRTPQSPAATLRKRDAFRVRVPAPPAGGHRARFAPVYACVPACVHVHGAAIQNVVPQPPTQPS